ncbi:MAG: hypothetical protein VX527_06320 [Planctomycetota bacterium]|nr:hypothetical protein [Planctomycetota bacterium]
MTWMLQKCLLCLACVLLGASGIEGRFEDRLLALRPSDAKAYFRLGEDIAEIAQTDQDRQLAIRLFALAAHLDQNRYRRSALLAIQPLVDDVAVQQLLDANLRAWREVADLLPMEATGDDRGDDTVLAVVEVLSALRRGDQSGIEHGLLQEGVADRLDSLEPKLPGDTRWMLNKAGSARKGKQVLGEDGIMSTLRVQGELLGTTEQPWSVVLHSGHGAPMTVIDPMPVVEIFSINPNQATWRGGRWEE